MLSSQSLFIIDDPSKNQQISNYFTQFGFTVNYFPDLISLKKLDVKPAALLINCQILEHSSVSLTSLFECFYAPLIVISDTPNEKIGIQVLENGADDFLVKPINPRELHARIMAINRRIQKPMKALDSEKEVIIFNSWYLYPASRQLFNNKNQEVKLSTSEYNLLFTFLHQPQKILGREFLLQLTKNSDLNPLDRRIDIQISRLRQKIEPCPQKPVLIKTIRNGGYIFTAEVSGMKKP